MKSSSVVYVRLTMANTTVQEHLDESNRTNHSEGQPDIVVPKSALLHELGMAYNDSSPGTSLSTVYVEPCMQGGGASVFIVASLVRQRHVPGMHTVAKAGSFQACTHIVQEVECLPFWESAGISILQMGLKIHIPLHWLQSRSVGWTNPISHSFLPFLKSSHFSKPHLNTCSISGPHQHLQLSHKNPHPSHKHLRLSLKPHLTPSPQAHPSSTCTFPTNTLTHPTSTLKPHLSPSPIPQTPSPARGCLRQCPGPPCPG